MFYSQCVQGQIIDGLAKLASTDGDNASLANLEETHAPDKAVLEKSLKPSEEKSADTQLYHRNLKLIKNTLRNLATKIVQDGTQLKGYKEHSLFLHE